MSRPDCRIGSRAPGDGRRGSPPVRYRRQPRAGAPAGRTVAVTPASPWSTLAEVCQAARELFLSPNDGLKVRLKQHTSEFLPDLPFAKESTSIFLKSFRIVRH